LEGCVVVRVGGGGGGGGIFILWDVES
jgi:hypothetical protein